MPGVGRSVAIDELVDRVPFDACRIFSSEKFKHPDPGARARTIGTLESEITREEPQAMKILRERATTSFESRPAAVLARQCERALVAAARSVRVSTRKRIHRAAREFIRRHGRNRSYLAWVMKRVAANAALAIALLGLGQGAANAAAPVFDPSPTNPYPFDGTVIGGTASPAVADLDADGDLDLLVGALYGFIPTTRYFENTGSATAPAYVERTGLANPLQNTTLQTMPAVGDLNGDGRLDVVTVGTFGSLSYYVNTGTPTTPGFALSPTNPFGSQSVGALGTPSLVDLDGDGDLDLVSGNLVGELFYLQNTGTSTAPAFISRVGSANPLSAFAGSTSGPGSQTAPALGDFDGDGDADVAIGTAQNGLRYLENTGNATSPAFRELVQAANPFRGEAPASGAGRSRLAVADLDADGDLDILRGDYGGRVTRLMNQFGHFVISEDIPALSLVSLPNSGFLFPTIDLDGDGDLEIANGCGFFRNVGSSVSPEFLDSFAESYPGLGLLGCVGAPNSFDVDRDRDPDLSNGWQVFRNTGSATAPIFADPGTSNLGFPPTSPLPGTLGSFYGATFADVDRDGDSDAAVTYETSLGFYSLYFENSGIANGQVDPTFKLRTGSANPLPNSNFVTIPLVAPIALSDVDGDGDGDSVAGDLYAENVGTTSVSFRHYLPSDRKHPFFPYLATGASFGSQPPVFMGDLDGDGDRDTLAYVDELFQNVFFENSIFRPSPQFTGPITPLSGTLDAGSFSSLGVGDLDGDGDPDLVASESFASGALRFYQNIGSATAPRLVERSGSANPFTGLNAGWTPILAMGDLDADGDLDLLSGEYSVAALRYFENTGTSTTPAFVARTGIDNPAANVIVERSSPALGDLDRDGDLDLVIGSNPGTFRLFRNTGTADDPAFTEVAGPSNPFEGLVAGVGFISNPALGDVDRDGDLDLLSGDETTGGFHYFENTGTATAPAFVARTGSENPAEGKSVGLNSTPALVDLDGDSELDLVSGDRDGQVETYFLPEPSRGMLLSAGIALLGWLRRRRG